MTALLPSVMLQMCRDPGIRRLSSEKRSAFATSRGSGAHIATASNVASDVDPATTMFNDRSDAGRQLARLLAHLRGEDVVVIGLPRGGVPVAYEVALVLDAPLDVILVRKLGVPFQPELGMGAIGESGIRVLNDEIVRTTGVTPGEIAEVEALERVELERRARSYRAGRPRTQLAGRVVLVVDDGIATGSTAKVACEAARAEGARRVILAVPVAPADWTHRLVGTADEFISVTTSEDFDSIGQFYRDFRQTSDDEVISSLDRAAARRVAPSSDAIKLADDPPERDVDVVVRAGHERLGGHLTVPEHAKGIVLFAHGSGSSRHSPRNRYVASVLNEAGLATLLFDLLTPIEEGDRSKVFDIDLLGSRLTEVTRMVRSQPDLAGLSIGYFGASTGAGAALRAAADTDNDVAAIVSRGGRPDLADQFITDVRAPTLLIVGGQDEVVLSLNQAAQARLRCHSRLEVVPGATHLFEEPGTLLAAAELARDWFVSHLISAKTSANLL